MAILWREKRGIHIAPAEGNFINEQGTVMKPQNLQTVTVTQDMWKKETGWPTATS